MTHVRVLDGSSCTLVSLCEQMNTTRIIVHLSTANDESVSLLMRFEFAAKSEEYSKIAAEQHWDYVPLLLRWAISTQNI